MIGIINSQHRMEVADLDDAKSRARSLLQHRSDHLALYDNAGGGVHVLRVTWNEAGRRRVHVTDLPREERLGPPPTAGDHVENVLRVLREHHSDSAGMVVIGPVQLRGVLDVLAQRVATGAKR